MTKTARHPLRRRFSGGNATGRGSFGTTCGTARPACGPAAAHDDGPDRTRRLPTPGRRPPGSPDAPAYRPQRSAHSESETLRTSAKRPCTARAPIRSACTDGLRCAETHDPPPIPDTGDPVRIARPKKAPLAACVPQKSHLAPERSGLAASGPQFRTIPPDRGRAAPVRRRSCIRIARRARPAGQATVPDRRQPRMRAVRKLTVRQTSDCSPDYHRPRKPIVRKPPPRPAGGSGVVSGEKSTPARSRPRLSAPQTNGHKKTVSGAPGNRFVPFSIPVSPFPDRPPECDRNILR